MKIYLVYGILFEDMFSLRKFFPKTYLVYGFFFLKIYLVYGVFLEDIFSLRERVLELQKAQGPDLAPNPVKQAFFKRKKSIFRGP